MRKFLNLSLSVALLWASILSTANALPTVDQTGNLAVNGNFENGTTEWVTTGQGTPSAFTGFLQWTQFSSPITTATRLTTDPLFEGDFTGHIKGETTVDGVYQYQVREAGTYTAGAWFYVVSGAAHIVIAWNGGFSAALSPNSSTLGSWEYLEITATVTNSLGGPLIYASGPGSEFFVEGLWHNKGAVSTSPLHPSTGFNPNNLKIVSCAGFAPPLGNGPVTVKGGRVLPVRVEIFDADGFPVDDSDLSSPPVIKVVFTAKGGGEAVDVTDSAPAAGQGTEGNQLEYKGAQWRYNLSTRFYSAPGAYTITIESGNPSEYLIDSPETSFFIE